MDVSAQGRVAYLSLSRLIQFGGVAILVCVGAPVLLVMFIGPLLFAGTPGHIAADERWSALAHSTAMYHPLLFYFIAFWFLAAACGRLAAGRMFQDRTIRAVAIAGVALMLGALASMVTRPMMLAGVFGVSAEAAEKMGYLRTMYGHLGMKIDAAVIGAVGGMMVLMAFVMRRGAAAQAENEQMF